MYDTRTGNTQVTASEVGGGTFLDGKMMASVGSTVRAEMNRGTETGDAEAYPEPKKETAQRAKKAVPRTFSKTVDSREDGFDDICWKGEWSGGWSGVRRSEGIPKRGERPNQSKKRSGGFSLSFLFFLFDTFLFSSLSCLHPPFPINNHTSPLFSLSPLHI